MSFRLARRGCIGSKVGWGQLTEKRIRRGSFFSVEELVQAINEYLEENNCQPKPFLWTARVEKILEKVNRRKAILEAAH
jgi:hypothetical protein